MSLKRFPRIGESFAARVAVAVPSSTIMISEIVDRLNNVLTGIAIKSGVLKSKTINEELRAELNQLEGLAIEAVSLLRQLAPAP